MNFQEMYSQIQCGKKARRPTWDAQEFITLIEQFVVHNRPYFENDANHPPINVGNNKRYYYVVEKDDPVAKDWEVVE